MRCGAVLALQHGLTTSDVDFVGYAIDIRAGTTAHVSAYKVVPCAHSIRVAHAPCEILTYLEREERPV